MTADSSAEPLPGRPPAQPKARRAGSARPAHTRRPGSYAHHGPAHEAVADAPRDPGATPPAPAVVAPASKTPSSASPRAGRRAGAMRQVQAAQAAALRQVMAAQEVVASAQATAQEAVLSAQNTAQAAQRAAEAALDQAASAVDSAREAWAGSPPEVDGRPVLPPRRLSGFDFATWRSASHDPAMRSPMVALVLMDSSPNWDRLVDRFDRASRIAPILRQRVVQGPTDMLNPRLVVDPNFDLAFHMRRFRVSEPGTWDQVLDETRRHSMADFDLARPLWHVTLLEGLQGGGSVLIVKMHHAIADGQGAMMLGASTIDLDPDGLDLGPMPPAPLASDLDTAGFLTHALKDSTNLLWRAGKEVVDSAVPLATKAVTNPRGLIGDAARIARSVARFTHLPTQPLSPLMKARSINYHFITYDLPMSELKAAAKAGGATLNDAFMAGITGGLRIYHERRGEPVDSLRANMPISLRDPRHPAQNALTIARFAVPVGEKDPGTRMRQIAEIVAAWKREPALHFVDPLAEVGSRMMPQEFITAAAQRSDFTASNMPGVPVSVWVAGARVRAMYPMVGTVGAATNITLLSYDGMAGIGVSTDDAAIPDRALFAECLGEGFAEVLGRPVTTSDPLAV
ncbi:MAG: wax ester/triacylglycerol synthase domain-containing protein [Candidatus Nanopelagicales bacterium]